jgi:hypothetical protein
MPGAKTAPGEAMAMISGGWGSLGEAWGVAAKTLRTGESSLGDRWAKTSKLAEFAEIPTKAVSAANLDLTGVWGSAVDYLGAWVVRMPGTILTATDDFFKVINYRADLRAQATRSAYYSTISDGLTGAAARKEMDARIARYLTMPPQGAERPRSSSRPRKPGRSSGGWPGRPDGRHTPGGADRVRFRPHADQIFVASSGARSGSDVAVRRISARRAAPGSRIAKIGLGSMTMGLMGVYASGGITGSGPRPRAQAYLNAGWQPYSIRIGNTCVGYNRRSRRLLMARRRLHRCDGAGSGRPDGRGT